MPIFKSTFPDVEIPDDLTVWQWAFESKFSPLKRYPESQLAGFLDHNTKERVSWSQVKDHAIHVSTALVKEYGLQSGETVTIFSRNSIWYPVMMQAVTRVGGVVSGASPAYGVEEMVHALKTNNAKFLATVPTSIDVAIKAADQVGIGKDRIFLLEGTLDGHISIRDLIAIGKSYGPKGQTLAYEVPRGKKSSDICGFLSFSSGTTGLPKAVMISHYNMIAQCMQIGVISEPTHRKILAVLPFFHIIGLAHVLHLCFLRNAEVVMLPGFTLSGMLEAIQEHRIREVLLVPPILILLVRDPIVEKYDTSSVGWFASGAAPVSPEVMALMEKKFPGTGFKQGWGMTESTACITMTPPKVSTWRYAHTVGMIVPNTEVRIVREDGSEAGVGEPGEILARGPQVTMGYLGRPDATAETFSEGGDGGGIWLHTGDQGHINADGTIQITDRIKELIKVKGIGVAPAELEDALLGHPDVEDAAVIGVPDAYAGERPKAYVVARRQPGTGAAAAAPPPPDSELGARILRHIRDSKVRYKWIAELEFVDAIPKSPTGKILRKDLRARERSGRDRGLVVRHVDDAPGSKL